MKLTIKEALSGASFQLNRAGLDSSRREAQALLAACLGKPLAYLFAHENDLMQTEAVFRYFNWIERRVKGEPFAYICGEKEFYGLPFFVDQTVLIPRPETEILVETVVSELKNETDPHILEIGTGSGAIAVTLASVLPQSRVTACDISLDALSVALSNAVRHGVQDRVRFFCGDLYAPLAEEETFFSAVVSNPPYIVSGDIPYLDPTVRQFEPHQALDGGADGLLFYRRLAGELYTLSDRPCMLAFEVGQGQAAAVSELCQIAGYKNTRQIKDLAGIPRVVLAKSIR